MTHVSAYAANTATSQLEKIQIQRRETWAKDVQIEILYCWICHSDIHQARNEWGMTNFPIVPGHEMVGLVSEVWSDVKKFNVWDTVGVWCFVDSCRTCPQCNDWLEQYCDAWFTWTYNAPDKTLWWFTYGWYSKQIVVTEDFVYSISDTLPIEKVAPLLCAGITTYSPLKHRKVWKWHTVWILWLGWLWHMAVKFASSFGAEVTILSRSPEKQVDAENLGADHFVLTTEQENLEKLSQSFDFIINTVSANHDYNMYINMLKVDWTMICLWAPPTPSQVWAFNLIRKRRTLAWSLIGWVPETQEMLDYCAEHGITSDVEIIAPDQINEAYERVLTGDVKYRFVIDMERL